MKIIRTLTTKAGAAFAGLWLAIGGAVVWAWDWFGPNGTYRAYTTWPPVAAMLDFLAKAPWYFPAGLMVLAGVFVWWLVWSSLKPERDFQRLYAKADKALAVVDECRELVKHRLAARHLEQLSVLLAQGEERALQWATSQNPNPLVEKDQIGRLQISQSKLLMEQVKKSVEVYTAWPVDFAGTAVAGKDMTAPFPQEDGRIILDAKRHDMRVMLHQLEYAKSLIAASLESSDRACLEIERKLGPI